MAALTAAWSRAAGAVGLVQSPAPPQQPSRYFTVADHINQMWRDIYRRKIDGEFYAQKIVRRTVDVMQRLDRGEIDEITASSRMLALHSEALQHPEPPREIPPLPADEVGVDEVMTLLRRAIAGEARIVVERPWTDIWHTDGAFAIDGWRLSGFKRRYGIKSMSEAIAPDGRRGTYDSWSAREGNPVHLLDNDEQDRLSKIMEALTP